jgi:hypothetical protein
MKIPTLKANVVARVQNPRVLPNQNIGRGNSPRIIADAKLKLPTAQPMAGKRPQNASHTEEPNT